MTDPCLACNQREASIRSLCRSCYMSVYRRVRRGESWVEAVADRVRQVQRAGRGWTSGLSNKQEDKA